MGAVGSLALVYPTWSLGATVYRNGRQPRPPIGGR